MQQKFQKILSEKLFELYSSMYSTLYLVMLDKINNEIYLLPLKLALTTNCNWEDNYLSKIVGGDNEQCYLYSNIMQSPNEQITKKIKIK